MAILLTFTKLGLKPIDKSEKKNYLPKGCTELHMIEIVANCDQPFIQVCRIKFLTLVVHMAQFPNKLDGVHESFNTQTLAKE